MTRLPDPTGMDDPASATFAYRRARRAVRALRGWYLHALVYLAVNAWLWIRFNNGWAQTSWHGPFGGHGSWPSGPALAWGLGLLLHGVVVWSRYSSLGRSWEDRKIRELMARDRPSGA